MRVAAHHPPDELAAVILEHGEDRALIDAEIVARHPAEPRDRAAVARPDVGIETLSPRAAFLALIRGTFNRRLVTAERLERQFDTMARLADRVVVKTLAYPRTIDRLPDVRAAVLADLDRG